MSFARDDDVIEYTPTDSRPPYDTECRRRDAALREAIDRAVDRSTKKVFAILGVDIDEPESVEKFRQDLRFAGKTRVLAEKGMMAVILAALSAIGYAIVEIFRTGMRGG